MNHPFHHELLSAYLDDEVTPAERGMVEDRLEADPDARFERDELDHVSSLLRDLPRLTAPVDLRAAILADVRSSQSAERHPARPTVSPAPPRDQSRGRLGAIAALVATLACAIVVTSMLGPDIPATSVDVAESGNLEFGARSTSASDKIAAAFVRDKTTADAVAPLDEPRPDGRSIAATAPDPAELGMRGGTQPPDLALAENSTGRLYARNLADGERRARASVDDQGADRFGGLAAAGEPRTFLLKETDLAKQRGYVDPVDPEHASLAMLDALAPGDVVPFVDRTGGRVAVVEVTVADVRRAYGEVQILLKRNAISELEELPAPGEEAAITSLADPELGKLEQPETRSKNAQRKAGEDDLFAVYVTTTPQRLAATLAELRKSELVVDLQSSAPEELLADRGSQVPTDEKFEEKDDRGTKPAAPSVALAENAPQPPGAPSPPDDLNESRSTPAGPANRAEGETPSAGEKPADNLQSEFAEAKKEPGAAQPEEAYRQVRQVENSYQLLRRADPVATRAQLAREESVSRRDLLAESVRPEALRPAAAAAIRARHIDDDSVRVLILLRPAPK